MPQDQTQGESFFSEASKQELKQLNGRTELAPLMKVLTAAGVTYNAVVDPINTAKDLPLFVEGMLNIDPAVRGICWNDINKFLATESETLTGPELNFWTDQKNMLNDPNTWYNSWLKQHGKHRDLVVDCTKAVVCWCGEKHCGAGLDRWR